MEPFLKQIARTFYAEKGNEIADTVFVFPSRRASVFFTQYLTEITESTFFAPVCYTLSDFFNLLAPKIEVEDKLGLLFRLYECYIQISHSQEQFDDFISFGEIILKDFNDVDNYLADAKALFTNISDLKELEDHDYLEPAQIEALKRYLGYFHHADKEIQRIAGENWKILWPLYQAFKENLLQDHIAYDGMLHRIICEQEQLNWDSNKEVVFIGFNALDGVTRQLFRKLRDAGAADFYWDYQSPYLQDKDNKAHYFTEQNLKEFPSKREINWAPLPQPVIHSIGIPSQIGQAKYSYQILNQWNAQEGVKEESTAVVLANEQLLIPLLYSLPEERSVNVTMGYPLKNSSVKKLLEDCLLLQHNYQTKEGFSYQQVNSILEHPYILDVCGFYKNFLPSIFYKKLRISPKDLLLDTPETFPDKAKTPLSDAQKVEFETERSFIQLLFTPHPSTEYLGYLNKVIESLIGKIQPALDKEFLHQSSLALIRMDGLMQKYSHMQLKATTFMQLIRQVINGISISFIGEPISGLQIMGMLETRCLDFERLIICSFNEGIFPKADTSHSIIPYTLRKAFGLPTTEHQDAVYAYNFYHLISRAKEVYLLYDTRNDIESGQGEVSRFAKQLKYLYEYPLIEESVNYPTTIPEVAPIQIAKDSTTLAELEQFLCKRGLSPSALNTYLECPLHFYFQHVKQIRVTQPASLDVASNEFGTIYHDVMEHLYQPYKGQKITKELLQNVKKDTKNIQLLLQRAFVRTLYDIRNDEEIDSFIPYTYKGTQKMIAEILTEYINYSIDRDIERSFDPRRVNFLGQPDPRGFIHLAEEEKIDMPFTLTDGTTVRLKGIIDRIDQKLNGMVQLYDYKTTKLNDNKTRSFLQAEDLFERAPNPKMYKKELLQLCYYNQIYKYRHPEIPGIEGHLYFVRDTPKEEFNAITQLSFPMNTDWEAEFEECLRNTIQEMKDPTLPFSQAKEEEACKYCDFKSICGK